MDWRFWDSWAGNIVGSHKEILFMLRLRPLIAEHGVLFSGLWDGDEIGGIHFFSRDEY